MKINCLCNEKNLQDRKQVEQLENQWVVLKVVEMAGWLVVQTVVGLAVDQVVYKYLLSYVYLPHDMFTSKAEMMVAEMDDWKVALKVVCLVV